MIVRSSPFSPFGRKVTMAAAILGLSSSITVVPADTASETDSIRKENPLGKIPTLVFDDGETLFDSSVIVAYLDHIATTTKLLPTEPTARFAAMRLEVLADGISEAALLIVYEGRWREATLQSSGWLEHQNGKIARGLAALEASPPQGPLTVGHVALACTLGYLDLRLAGRWRTDHPALVAWLGDFEAAVPAFAATRPPAA